MEVLWNSSWMDKSKTISMIEKHNQETHAQIWHRLRRHQKHKDVPYTDLG